MPPVSSVSKTMLTLKLDLDSESEKKKKEKFGDLVSLGCFGFYDFFKLSDPSLILWFRFLATKDPQVQNGRS